jgi:hypothetical protein
MVSTIVAEGILRPLATAMSVSTRIPDLPFSKWRNQEASTFAFLAKAYRLIPNQSHNLFGFITVHLAIKHEIKTCIRD